MDFEFVAWPKIPRLGAPKITITEKIDGTNAQINITLWDTSDLAPVSDFLAKSLDIDDARWVIQAGSRNRWVSPDEDNFGFAAWVWDHAAELISGLGEGRHYGEWYGAGIQRRYGLAEKRFALFNASRWGYAYPPPKCCHVVPIIPGEYSTVDEAMETLHSHGSFASPGYMNPEGVVMWDATTRTLVKKTFDHPKGKWSAFTK